MDGVAVFKTSDKSCYETYRFAKLKSWAASPTQVTFKVSKDDKNHKLQCTVRPALKNLNTTLKHSKKALYISNLLLFVGEL